MNEIKKIRGGKGNSRNSNVKILIGKPELITK